MTGSVIVTKQTKTSTGASSSVAASGFNAYDVFYIHVLSFTDAAGDSLDKARIAFEDSVDGSTWLSVRAFDVISGTIPADGIMLAISGRDFPTLQVGSSGNAVRANLTILTTTSASPSFVYEVFRVAAN